MGKITEQAAIQFRKESAGRLAKQIYEILKKYPTDDEVYVTLTGAEQLLLAVYEGRLNLVAPQVAPKIDARVVQAVRLWVPDGDMQECTLRTDIDNAMYPEAIPGVKIHLRHNLAARMFDAMEEDKPYVVMLHKEEVTQRQRNTYGELGFSAYKMVTMQADAQPVRKVWDGESLDEQTQCAIKKAVEDMESELLYGKPGDHQPKGMGSDL